MSTEVKLSVSAMVGEFTPDARRRLANLLSEAVEAAGESEEGEVRDGVTAVREVLEEEADDTPLRGRLFHGCDEVERTLSEDPEVAAEYLRSMEARIRDEAES